MDIKPIKAAEAIVQPLNIVSITPEVPFQGSPMQISFTLENFSDKDISGNVSGIYGGTFQIPNLASHSTIEGSITFPAPKAGKNVKITLGFYDATNPLAVNLGASSANAVAIVDIMTGYILEATGLDGPYNPQPFPPLPYDANNPNWSRDLVSPSGQTFLLNANPVWEWTPVLDPHDEFDTKLVGISGTAVYPTTNQIPNPLSDRDNPFYHPFGFDFVFFIAPDSPYMSLLAPNNFLTGTGAVQDRQEYIDAIQRAKTVLNLDVSGVLGVETDQGLVPTQYRVEEGDRVAVFGRWIVDCGHADFHTEIHPPLLLARAKSISQDVTYSTVVSRPYLVSQEFDDGALRQHLINEVLKLVPVVPTWLTFGIPAPRSWQVEAHPHLKNPPFSGDQTMTYVVRPASPRSDPSVNPKIQ